MGEQHDGKKHEVKRKTKDAKDAKKNKMNAMSTLCLLALANHAYAEGLMIKANEDANYNALTLLRGEIENGKQSVAAIKNKNHDTLTITQNAPDTSYSKSGANISNPANEVDYTQLPRDYAFLGSEIRGNPTKVDLDRLLRSENQVSTYTAGNASKFQPGARVRIRGLQSDLGRTLNGQEGQLVAFNQAKGRWQVKVNGFEKMIKPVNLVALPPTAGASSIPAITGASSTPAPEPTADASSTPASGPTHSADNVPDDNADDYEKIETEGDTKIVLKHSAAYRILGLPQGESYSKRIIKRTHAKLFLKWQKTSASSSGTKKADAERMLRMLNEAKGVLIKNNLANQVHRDNP